ncbi:MAG TPA: hypothetical protein VF188_13145 [Longimicrobiales bacterium]
MARSSPGGRRAAAAVVLAALAVAGRGAADRGGAGAGVVRRDGAGIEIVASRPSRRRSLSNVRRDLTRPSTLSGLRPVPRRCARATTSCWPAAILATRSSSMEGVAQEGVMRTRS